MTYYFDFCKLHVHMSVANSKPQTVIVSLDLISKFFIFNKFFLIGLSAKIGSYLTFINFWTGVGSLGAIGVMVILLLFGGYIATQQFKLQKELLFIKGCRIKILNEVLVGIKVSYIQSVWAMAHYKVKPKTIKT